MLGEIAQTNIQLYNQLREIGFRREGLLVVHRAYELLTTLYPSVFQADGKPFVAHGVGVASLLARLDQPAEVLAVGLLHNVYGNGDFGDGRDPGVTPRRRQIVRSAVGDPIERLVARFGELRTLRRSTNHLTFRDEDDRRLTMIEVVDYVEKHADLGVLYYGPNSALRRNTDQAAGVMLDLARAVGESRLVEMLSEARAATETARSEVPAGLWPTDGRQASRALVPRSCRRRSHVWLLAKLRSLRALVQLRTRLRRLLDGATRRRRAVA